MTRHKLPANFRESMVFTLIMSFFMASIMYIFNQAVSSGALTWDTFRAYDYHFLIFWGIAYLLALFVARPLANKLTFRLVNPREDKPLIINLVMSTFMVALMSSMMSVVGVVFGAVMSGVFGTDMILAVLTGLYRGFSFALPLQILVVGPLVRYIFSVIYARKYASADKSDAV